MGVPDMPPGCSWLLSWLALTLALSPVCEGARQETAGEEQLIGWRGDTYNSQPEERLWIEQISWTPRAYIIHNLITPMEAKHVADLSWVHMKRSTVVSQINGSDVLDDYRTSYGTFLSRNHDEVVAAIQRRVALITHAPVVHQEDMQVLRYAVGQYYHKHEDSLDNDTPRMATMLIYLTDTEEGGETSFPDGSQWANPDMAQRYGADLSECAQGHVAYRPRQGDGLLFWSIHPDGTPDHAAMHEGCPVIKGSKWTCTSWIHTAPFRPETYHDQPDPDFEEKLPDPGLCLDESEECDMWKQQGECEKNPAYMRVHCMRSCGVCEACGETDQQCYNRNRRKLGYLVYNPNEVPS